MTATLAAGDDVTCTFTNTKGATLTIVKDAVPNDAQDFAFTGTGSGVSGFSLDDDADPGLSNTKVFTFDGNQIGDAKAVTESANPTGWTLTAVACSAGGTASLANRNVTATLAAGDAVSCTFTNTKDATLTIVKDAVPNDEQDFAFTGTGSGVSGFSLDDDADPGLSNTKVFTFDGNQIGDAKVVTESANPTGWTLTAVACSAGGTASLANRNVSATLTAGQSVSCTFTNGRPPTLIVKKIIQGQSETFHFTATNGVTIPDLTPAANSSAQTSSQIIQVGDYTITETNIVGGWLLTDAICTGASSTSTSLPSASFRLVRRQRTLHVYQ